MEFRFRPLLHHAIESSESVFQSVLRNFRQRLFVAKKNGSTMSSLREIHILNEQTFFHILLYCIRDRAMISATDRRTTKSHHARLENSFVILRIESHMNGFIVRCR